MWSYLVLYSMLNYSVPIHIHMPSSSIRTFQTFLTSSLLPRTGEGLVQHTYDKVITYIALSQTLKSFICYFFFQKSRKRLILLCIVRVRMYIYLSRLFLFKTLHFEETASPLFTCSIYLHIAPKSRKRLTELETNNYYNLVMMLAEPIHNEGI